MILFKYYRKKKKRSFEKANGERVKNIQPSPSVD
jgi:hypothetical protein